MCRVSYGYLDPQFYLMNIAIRLPARYDLTSILTDNISTKDHLSWQVLCFRLLQFFVTACPHHIHGRSQCIPCGGVFFQFNLVVRKIIKLVPQNPPKYTIFEMKNSQIFWSSPSVGRGTPLPTPTPFNPSLSNCFCRPVLYI